MVDKNNSPLADQGTVAVMDLGTNTFHLLIACGTAAAPQELFHITEPVKLGEGGINNGVIQPAAYRRGISTMQMFHQHILRFKVGRIKAAATSALRTAANGQDFINEVKDKTGISIELINGGQEAAYIYEGVKAGACLSSQSSLILDIGGGSVEFVIGNNERILWKQSFEIGAARIMDKFHRIDPIPASSIAELNNYLEKTLTSLFEAVKDIEIETLIGSSGAFETFAEVTELQKGHEFELKKNRKYTFAANDFFKITDWIIQSSHNKRENTKGIIPIRVDMIVAAALITRFVMKKLTVDQVMMSTYSLKEGILAEMLG
jgi:exopolyphosphatase/guanosine-5'-triphosphate,3'-diphosphate pyrophosphatase